MRFKTTLSFFGFSFSVSFSAYNAINFSVLIAKKPDKKTLGFTSRCRDGKHVLFFDWDGLSKQEVLEESVALQEYFKLSSFYIFELDREDSFHGVCLDKLNLYSAIEVISNSSADSGFKKAPFLFRKKRWVLRISGKGARERPKYLLTVDSPHNKHDKSLAHKKFLEINYNLKLEKLKYLDAFNDTIELIEYDTANRTN